MSSWRAPATTARAACRPSRSRRAPGLSFGANENKMGWNAQPTRQVICEDCRVPAPTARRGGHRFQNRHGRPRRRPAQHRRLFARRRAGGARQSRRLYGRTQGLRQKARRIPGAAIPARRHGDRPGGRPHFSVARGQRARRETPDATRLCAMAKKFATDAGFEIANAALQLHGGYGYLSDYGVEKSSATCACTRFWKARTRSCG